MTTIIHSCGSKWAGEEPNSVDQLIEVMGAYALDRTFEAYGNFVIPLTADELRDKSPENIAKHAGFIHFFGNFSELSHVFSIETDEPELIERLTVAIRANQRRPDYLAQPDEVQRKAAEEAANAKRDAKRRKERIATLRDELSGLEG